MKPVIKRMDPDERRRAILEAAVTEVGIYGPLGITRKAVAYRAKVSPALVSHYFHDMKGLLLEVADYALATEHIPALAGLLAAHKVPTEQLHTELRKRVVSFLVQ